MPKREPTPPLEDESRYLIINYPFPLHANMQIKSERYDIAHWIASCIGQEYLTAIYHKPSAPNMVIIEVMKYCPRMNALLGAHKWCEFLRRPEPDQMGTESRIYYCRYSTGREVQKYGWRRIDVWDNWFVNYDPIDGPFITNPYPKTGFCEVPAETQTDYGLCRPLPTDLFPRPRPTNKQPIVPGSDIYVSAKSGSGQPIAAPAPSKQPTKSWASITSSNTARKTEVEGLRTMSRTSSTGSNSVASPISASFGTTTSTRPGLGPQSRLSTNSSQESSVWEFSPSPELITPSDSLGWPGEGTKVEIITAGLAAAAIDDQQGSVWNKECNDQSGSGRVQARNEEEEEQYWAEQPERPVDWDKPICPEHNIACRAGICKVMAELERKKKQKAVQKQRSENGDWRKRSGNGNASGAWNRDGDGWEQVNPRGRSGQGRGQTRGKARGGWC